MRKKGCNPGVITNLPRTDGAKRPVALMLLNVLQVQMRGPRQSVTQIRQQAKATCAVGVRIADIVVEPERSVVELRKKGRARCAVCDQCIAPVPRIFQRQSNACRLERR